MATESTSTVSFVGAEHGRLRRKQRAIDQKDLQQAKKYGDRPGTHPRPNGDPTSIYTYKDIVYITNDVTGEEVTAYPKPIQLEMNAYFCSQPVQQQLGREHWTSNTVLVVDTSGSMRTADVWGSRTRLGAVWVSIALDFLAHRIESGLAKPTDVISIVTLEQHPRVLVHEMACNWALYNIVACFNNNNSVPARGHGPFLPCLDVAENLLLENTNDACAPALVFLLDGGPHLMVQ